MTPPHRRGAAAAFQILAILTARLTEMHMAVDDPGQYMQPARVEILSCCLARDAAKLRESSAIDANIALPDTILIDDRAAADHHVEVLSHETIPWNDGISGPFHMRE